MSARTYGLRTAPAVTRYRKLTFDILGRSVGGANPRPYDRSSTDHAPRVASVRRNPLDCALAYHDHRRMGATRPGNARHHRCINHRQSLDALDPAILINHRHRIRIRSHLAGPGNMPRCAHGLPYPQVQSVVAGQNVIRRGGSGDRPRLHTHRTAAILSPTADPPARVECHLDAGDNGS